MRPPGSTIDPWSSPDRRAAERPTLHKVTPASVVDVGGAGLSALELCKSSVQPRLLASVLGETLSKQPLTCAMRGRETLRLSGARAAATHASMPGAGGPVATAAYHLKLLGQVKRGVTRRAMADWPDAKVPVPHGVHPLFLTMTTQEHYGCKEREQVTAEMPYVWVPKDTFLKEIQFKGAISDFFVCKKEISDYPGDELIIVWDEEENYGQNYFLCKTVEAAQRVVDDVQAALDAKAPAGGSEGVKGGADDAFVDIYTPPVSKEWVSQGSEVEIADERVNETRPTFVLQLLRRRREFHGVYKFTDRDAAEDPNIQQNDCRKYNDPNFELRRREHHLSIQVRALCGHPFVLRTVICPCVRNSAKE